jgi:hypothetical protein
MPANIVIFMHGMTTQERPQDPRSYYDRIWSALLAAQPALATMIDATIYTDWGLELPDGGGTGIGLGERRDRMLAVAQAHMIEATRDKRLTSGERLDVTSYDLPLLGPVRWLLDKFIREPVMQRGLPDVAYYMSAEGEGYVRDAVYAQILTQLAPFVDEPQVRLHVIAESLGVTVAHDFLFALFNPAPYVPGYILQTEPPPSQAEALRQWRGRAARGEVTLGSFIATASQLPMTLLRKQSIVERFYPPMPEQLDPSVIGVVGDQVHWLLFYDVDDLLAYPTRHLYSPRDAIEEVQVDSSDLPHRAHVRYWAQREVVERAAEQLLRTAS